MIKDPGALRCCVLGAFFLVGAAFGFLYARNTVSVGDKLLRDFFSQLDFGSGAAPGSFAVALHYLLIPVFLVLLGACAFGVVLIPLLSGVLGFFFMYPVAAMALAFGRQGVVLALAVFFLRLVVAVPCFLTIASHAWPVSLSFAVLGLGGGRSGGSVFWDRAYFRVLCVCVVILFAGILAERILTPVFLELVWERVMIYGAEG